jgi:hypothetical protein
MQMIIVGGARRALCIECHFYNMQATYDFKRILDASFRLTGSTILISCILLNSISINNTNNYLKAISECKSHFLPATTCRSSSRRRRSGSSHSSTGSRSSIL